VKADKKIYQGRKAYLFHIVVLLLLCGFPLHDQALAYIGPGAGFAVLSSFLMIFVAFLLAIINLISWPLRYAWRLIRGKNAYKNAKVKRVVILGLDGLDPELAQKYMSEGKLPHFQKLKEEGRFAPLETTFPSISPVAWSSFQTGTNPGKHNIFDFLTPEWKAYLPALSSAHIGSPKHHLNIGKYQIPIGKPSLKLLRRSVPFWNILGEKGIFANILRVPITFPPEKTKGLLLSAMCVPDLRGTQGSFTHFTSQDNGVSHTGGTHLIAKRKNGRYLMELPGPPNPMLRSHETINLPISISPNGKPDQAILLLDGKNIPLAVGQYSDWIQLPFKTGAGVKISGICKFLLKRIEPELDMYVTPINIDPDRPALPISYPAVYAPYLAKKLGPFATLGLAEDTWALNERVIDEAQFLQQTWDIHAEREKILFDALKNLDRGVLAIVFDSTDRIQHAFIRYLHPDHPANRGRDVTVHQNAIEHLYRECDALLGRLLARIDERTVLMVMSDHGFKPFKWGINLNRWLLDNGYLVLNDGGSGGEWFDGVDWSRSRAYALGLAGIFINKKGREGKGIVPKEQVSQLKLEIVAKLRALHDPGREQTAINEVYDSAAVLNGPYLANAPDLIVGYKPGYRASWASVTGTVMEELFSENTKAWSGDHCIDPRTVPGVFFCNKKVTDERLSIMDIAPTVLQLFGVEVPKYVDGKVLKVDLSARH
jgi:predicted AlkP superfamily phosphohydrolase/phosphomutase